MTKSRSAAFLVVLALLRTPGGHADTQEPDTSSKSVKQQVLSLDFADNGRQVKATVGQQIDITLGTIGGGHYGNPQVFTSAIRFENVALAWPPTPGGPTQTYIFEAVAEGQAQIEIAHTESKPTFAVTIQVGLPIGKLPKLHASMMPDQASTA